MMTYYIKWEAVICYKLGSWDLKLMNWCTLITLHVQQFFLCFGSKSQELTGWLNLNEFSSWPWVLHEFNHEFFFMAINFNEFSSWPWVLHEFNHKFFFMAINFNFLHSHEFTIIPMYAARHPKTAAGWFRKKLRHFTRTKWEKIKNTLGNAFWSTTISTLSSF